MSISREGKMVSASFAELRKYGFVVTNFNTHKHVKTGSMQKLTDYIIAGHTGLHFIEVKLESTGDSYKPHQLMFKTIIDKIAGKCIWIHYWKVVSLEQANFVFEMILNGSPDQKGERLSAI